MSLYKLPLRRKKEYLGLNKIPVWYEDSSQDSEKIFGISNLPKEFNAGKNIIKILGTESLEYLTEVSIEILDSQGEPIYWEIPDYVDFAKRRSIVVWIYPETPTGLGSITIVGTLKDSDVPDEWRDKPNVRWKRDVEVDPTSPNKDEIAFGHKPTISIEEKFKTVSRPEFSGGLNEPINVNITNVKYKSSKISQGPIDNVETYEDASKKYRDSTNNKNIWTTWNENSISTPKGLKSIANLGRDFDKSKYYSPLVKRVNKAKLKAESGGSIVTSPNGDFVAEMEGGETAIDLSAITNPVFSPATLKAGESTLTVLNGTYNYEIAQVINKHTIRLTDTIKDKAGNALISGDIGVIKVFYTPPPISYSESQKYQNFARVKMYNLEPVSGDIYKIKLYSRNQESQDNKFELVTDRILEPNNLLIDRNVEIENLEIGVLPSASLVTSYWSASSHPNGSQPASSDVQATADSTNIKRGIAVSSSQANSTIDSGFAKLQPVSGSSIYSIDTYSSSSYIFEFDIYGKTVTGNFETDGIVYVCLSGSAIENRPRNNTESKMFDDVNFQGQVLHEISINDFSKTTNGTILIDDSALTFQTDNDGTLTPVFIMKGGKWAFSEIRLKPYAEAGFTPSHLEFDLPVPPTFDGTTMDFKVEFLDYLGNVSKEIAYVNNIPFQNGNQVYQQGDKNINIGKQTFGTDFEKGVIIETAENPESASKFGTSIRSAGFRSYAEAIAGTAPAGWMFSSGSISGSNDKGATFELASPSASFKFSSDPNDPDAGLQIVATSIESNTIIISGSSGGITSSYWTGSYGTGINRESDVYITGSIYQSGDFFVTQSSEAQLLWDEGFFWHRPGAETILYRYSANAPSPGVSNTYGLRIIDDAAILEGRSLVDIDGHAVYLTNSQIAVVSASESSLSDPTLHPSIKMWHRNYTDLPNSRIESSGSWHHTGSFKIDTEQGVEIHADSIINLSSSIIESTGSYSHSGSAIFNQSLDVEGDVAFRGDTLTLADGQGATTYSIEMPSAPLGIDGHALNITAGRAGGFTPSAGGKLLLTGGLGLQGGLGGDVELRGGSATAAVDGGSVVLGTAGYQRMVIVSSSQRTVFDYKGIVVTGSGGGVYVGPTKVGGSIPNEIALYYDEPGNNLAAFQREGGAGSAGEGTGRMLLFYTGSAKVANITAQIAGGNDSFLSGGGLAIGSSYEYVGAGITSYLLELDTDSAGKPTSNTWTITSDERLKEGIVTASIDICYNNIKNIPLKYFGYKEGFTKDGLYDQHMIGWVAQDVEAVIPKAVTTSSFTTWSTYTGSIAITGSYTGPDGEAKILYPGERYRDPLAGSQVIDDKKSLDSDQIIKMMYGAIQKLQQKVEALEAQLSGSN